MLKYGPNPNHMLYFVNRLRHFVFVQAFNGRVIQNCSFLRDIRLSSKLFTSVLKSSQTDYVTACSLVIMNDTFLEVAEILLIYFEGSFYNFIF